MTGYRINRIAFIGTVLGLLIGLVAIAGMPAATAARVTPRQRHELRFQHVSPAKWTDREVRMTIRAAVRRWPVPGGVRMALSVARCESGFEARDSSPGSGFEGVYQQATRYWPGRQNAADGHPLDLRESVNNGRANVVVSIRQAHAGGWGPWQQGACA